MIVKKADNMTFGIFYHAFRKIWESTIIDNSKYFNFSENLLGFSEKCLVKNTADIFLHLSVECLIPFCERSQTFP